MKKSALQLGKGSISVADAFSTLATANFSMPENRIKQGVSTVRELNVLYPQLLCKRAYLLF